MRRAAGHPGSAASVEARSLVELDLDGEAVRDLPGDDWRVVGLDAEAIVEVLSAPEGVG